LEGALHAAQARVIVRVQRGPAPPSRQAAESPGVLSGKMKLRILSAFGIATFGERFYSFYENLGDL